MADWLPKKENEFAKTCEKWIVMLQNTGYQTDFQWTESSCNALITIIKAFLIALENYIDSDTSEHLTTKNNTKKTAESAMRKFANSHIRYNDSVDDETRIYMGIPLRDATPTAHPAPATQPELTTENTPNHFEHKLITKARGKSKPADAYGVRYAWKVGGEKPVTGADLPKSMFSRRTSVVIIHTEAEKGKPAYYAACYENAKGQPGPWSPVVEAYIG